MPAATGTSQSRVKSPVVPEGNVKYTISSYIFPVLRCKLKSDACRKQESKIFLGDAIFPVVFPLFKKKSCLSSSSKNIVLVICEWNGTEIRNNILNECVVKVYLS